MQKQTTITVRRSDERGHANHGWLESRHTFSFADYYDPAHMGFRSLRVINDDIIAPLGGFPTHGHRNMEIFSYVLEGRLAHEDSMGNKRELKPGEIQLMRAGSGVSHSEFNPSSTEQARLLQIWIIPAERELEPAYSEWTPPANAGDMSKLPVISPDGRDGSAHIAQDAVVYRLLTGKSETIAHDLTDGRGVWLHVIRGEARVGDTTLHPGDAAAIEQAGKLEIQAGPDGLEALLFDLA
ncbi:MAG TPA: pirin family protein [Luteolibacter sp.]|nr:pirin family protein [Luteolibacter sp.]